MRSPFDVNVVVNYDLQVRFDVSCSRIVYHCELYLLYQTLDGHFLTSAPRRCCSTTSSRRSECAETRSLIPF